MENICEACEVLTETKWGLCPDCAADAADVWAYLAEEFPEDFE